jgi:molybdate transport system substrate-binding protein
MTEIRILSAGAAQAVVEKIGAEYTRETGVAVKGEFSAVGAIRDRIVAGAAADVIVLTGVLIDELIVAGRVIAGTRADLGKVGTGVAVRSGRALPDVSSGAALRARLLAAGRLVCPDPATATAGKVVLQLLERLGIAAEMKPKMQFFPNGYAAMRWLSESTGPSDTGITQITEIRANPGVTYAGPLPGELQVKTVYAAGLAAGAAAPGAARAFIERLTSSAAQAVLADAGYELDR